MNISLTTLRKAAALIKQANRSQPQLLIQLERARVSNEFRQEMFVDTLALTAETLIGTKELNTGDAQVLRSVLYAAVEADIPSLKAMVGFTSLMAGKSQRSLSNGAGRKLPGAKVSAFYSIDAPHSELHHWSHT